MLAIVICATRITRIWYALSKFSGGGVWQQLSRVPSSASFLIHGCGEVLPLQPALVHARARCHATEPWQGAKCIIVAHLPESIKFYCQQRAHIFCSPLVFACLQPLRRGNLTGRGIGGQQVQQVLYMLAQSFQILGDPDRRFLRRAKCYANGVPLGHDRLLPRTSQVFRKR